MLIVGEPGLGKSRLIEEFHTRLGETPHTSVEWSCSQLLQNTPLHPIAEWGRQRFGMYDIPAERQLAELENTLGLIKLDPAENAPLLAPLLDIPLSPERAPALPPEELRRRQLAALTNLIMAGARELSPWCLRLKICIGLIRPRWTSLGASLSAALWPPCFFSSPPDPSFARPGQFAHITPRYLSPRLIAHRCAKWWRGYPPAMLCLSK